MPKPFAHVTAAIATPFKPGDQSVDFGLLSAHAHWLMENGCDGIVLFGTTGEAASLTIKERKNILHRLIADGIPARAILVGTGCCAVADTVELTQDVREQGCAGALVLPPYFFKGISESGVIRYYDALIAGCGADVPPLYLYNIPQTSGVPIGSNVVGELIARHGPVIRGYKDSAGMWANTADILSRFPDLVMYVGSEVLLLDNLKAGGAGCISASVNVQPALVRRLFDNWRGADAEALQAQATAVRKAMEKSGPLLPATKAMLAEIHREPAWSMLRPPLEALSSDKREALRAELKAQDAEGF